MSTARVSLGMPKSWLDEVLGKVSQNLWCLRKQERSGRVHLVREKSKPVSDVRKVAYERYRLMCHEIVEI